ncbi:ABC transporter permease [Desulfovibrio sp. OttesenSCG-928-I05]|nr:ABC transporter permease [Desulfovibrio sp. OttesenSCG-928-I05]
MSTLVVAKSAGTSANPRGRFSLRRRIQRYGLLWLGLFLVGSAVAAALLAPFLAVQDPVQLTLHQGLDAIFQPPSPAHPMGTDSLGRDVFSRMLYGAQVSLWVGFVSVGIATLIGVTLGLVAGYFGGIVDEIIMRAVDVMLCFPSFFLILTVIAFLEPSLVNIMIIIGLTSWMRVTRLVRAETLSLRERDFVAAARLAGAKSSRILIRHVLPNVMAPVLVSATLGIAGAILTESALSFLGLGMQPPMPSWGNMLLEGKESLEIAWWLSFFPGMAILLTVLGYNLLGESLRDLLDPRMR